MVVGFCEFVGLSTLQDLLDLASTADRCAAEAAAVVTRHGGTTERVLYDRLVARMPSATAIAACVELRAAVRALGIDVAVGVASGEARERPWGRAHLVARALSQAATPGEILLDDRLRNRIDRGFGCDPAGVLGGVRAWRLTLAVETVCGSGALP